MRVYIMQSQISDLLLRGLCIIYVSLPCPRLYRRGMYAVTYPIPNKSLVSRSRPESANFTTERFVADRFNDLQYVFCLVSCMSSSTMHPLAPGFPIRVILVRNRLCMELCATLGEDLPPLGLAQPGRVVAVSNVVGPIACVVQLRL